MMMEVRTPGWGLIPRMFREFEELEHYPWGWSYWPALWSRTSEDYYWEPPVELYEKDDKYYVRAELPGLTKDGIDVSVTENTLSIKGERKEDKEYKEGSYYLREHEYGTFSRAISLPSAVDADKIEATYENGILEVVIPKSPEVLPKKIPVSHRKKELKTATKPE